MHAARGLVALFVVLAAACSGGSSSEPPAERAPLGGECGRWADCTPDAEMCLKAEGEERGYCTRHCSSDADCGAAATCGTATIARTGGGSDRVGGERICVPRAPSP